jgi:hypothetical protein
MLQGTYFLATKYKEHSIMYASFSPTKYKEHLSQNTRNIYVTRNIFFGNKIQGTFYHVCLFFNNKIQGTFITKYKEH